MIYLTDYIADPSIEMNILSDNLATFLDETVDKEDVMVLLIWHFTVNEVVLKEYPNLIAIVRYGVGVDNVDLEACSKRGVKVFNNPDYGVDEVSDTALAMIMSLSRNIVGYNHIAQDLVRQPNEQRPWQENTDKAAKRLSDCTLGIIGVGRIGSALARKMLPIVKNIEFFDPFVSAGYEKTLKAKRHESLASLLSDADVVSVHVPLSAETKGFIDSKFVNQLKFGAIFVNTARGGLIDDLEVFYDALKSGHLSAIGLDVLPEEPPHFDGNQKFLNLWLSDEGSSRGRVIINPHTSYYSPESYGEMREKAAKIALNALYNKQKLNRII